MTLEEHHAELVERWRILREEMANLNYDFDEATGNGLALWVAAKKVQFGVIFEQPITKETNQRLDTLLTEAHGTMFFDAIAIGKKE